MRRLQRDGKGFRHRLKNDARCSSSRVEDRNTGCLPRGIEKNVSEILIHRDDNALFRYRRVEDDAVFGATEAFLCNGTSVKPAPSKHGLDARAEVLIELERHVAGVVGIGTKRSLAISAP
jgi:hypothetical protein